jgi:predicted ribosomally synthesized peptide with SipW-like signal peptide
VKKIIGLAISGLLLLALVAGGTYAYFSDTETSPGNSITAGTLNLTADVTDGGGGVTGTVTAGADGANEYITFTGVAPGQNGKITFTLKNTGSLAGHLTIASTGTSDENTIWEPEATAGDVTDGAGNGELGLYMQFSGTKGGTAIDLNDTDAGGQSFTLAKLVAYLNAESVALAANDSAPGGSDEIVYVITWTFPADQVSAGADGYFDTAGDNSDVDDNLTQSDSIIFSLTFTLSQDHA